MLFCPKCGSILKPTKKGDKSIMTCACGYTNEASGGASLKDTSKQSGGVDVVKEDADYEQLPVTEQECPKCGHTKCRYWLVQTRAADEPETKFLRCCSCKHTFRDYD